MSVNTSRSYNFHVNGMHCHSCVLLIDSELQALPEISKVKASLKNHSVEITGVFGDKNPSHIIRDLEEVLKPHGYTLSVERRNHDPNWADFKIAVPVALAFILLFIALQKIGLVNFVDASKITFGTAFAVGAVASVSTCMAVVGGLVLSMSATFAKEGDKLKPQVLFHVGRLVSFFILGGVIGALGSAFSLNTTATFVLGILVALVMIVLGLNLLDVFPWVKKLQPSMPKFISSRAHGVSKLNHTLTPLLVGVATFFLPCGFTQSMQLYTLTTGSFAKGALTMFAFALGTLPVLALMSFSSLSIHNKKGAGIFFKSAGLIVILFGLLNFINSLVVGGIIDPIFNL